jgi:hypothetical protein
MTEHADVAEVARVAHAVLAEIADDESELTASPGDPSSAGGHRVRALEIVFATDGR